jgi:hypothetical protein
MSESDQFLLWASVLEEYFSVTLAASTFNCYCSDTSVRKPFLFSVHDSMIVLMLVLGLPHHHLRQKIGMFIFNTAGLSMDFDFGCAGSRYSSSH